MKFTPKLLVPLQLLGIYLLQPWQVLSQVNPSTGSRIEENQLSKKVGALGEPEKLEFRGNQGFPASVIRNGLAGSPSYLNSAHELAPLDQYLIAIKDCMIRAYKNHGYPNVEVTVSLDLTGDQVIVDIEEGPLIRMGEVHISGVNEPMITDIVHSLTEPSSISEDRLGEAIDTILKIYRYPKLRAEAEAKIQALNEQIPTVQMGDASLLQLGGNRLNLSTEDTIKATEPPKAFWVSGNPVQFESDIKAVEEYVRFHLANQGYLLADIGAELNLIPSDQLAHLVIQVELGPAAIIREIRVEGNQRNTQEEVIARSGLVSGTPINPQVLKDVKLALWNSGRFENFDVSLEPLGANSNDCDVVIEVEESSNVPPLGVAIDSQELKIENALIKFANWISADAMQQGLEFQEEESGKHRLTLTLSKEKGLALAIESLEQEAWVALVENGTEIDLVVSRGGKIAATSFQRATSTVSPWIYSLSTNIQFGWKISTVSGGTKKKERRGMISPSVILSPHSALSNLFPSAEPVFENGNVLMVGSSPGNFALSFNEETGELTELLMGEIDERAENVLDPKITMQAGTQAFERISQMVAQAKTSLQQDPQMRVSFSETLDSSFLNELIGNEHASREFIDPYLEHLPTAVLFAEQLAPAVNDLWDTWRSSEGQGPAFVVPIDPTVEWQPGMLATFVGPMIYQWSRNLGASDSWPARLGRELFYRVNGQDQHSQAVLDLLYQDPDMGPVGSLITAQLLRRLDSREAWRFVERTLEHSSLEDFRADSRLLLDSDNIVSELIKDILALIGSFDKEDLVNLTSGLQEEEEKLVLLAHSTAQKIADQNDMQGIHSFLDTWWEESLQPYLEKRIGVLFGGAQSIDPAVLAATVNGMPLSRQLLELGRKNPNLLAKIPEGITPGNETPYDPPLEILIVLTLVLQDAVIRGFDLSDENTDKMIEVEINRRAGGNRAAFENMLKAQGMTYPVYRELYRLNSVYSSIHNSLLNSVQELSDQEINDAINQFISENKVRHIQMIYLPSNDATNRSTAQAILERANTDGFATVWKTYESTERGKPRQLNFPAANRSDLRAELATVSFDLPPGGVSGIIESGNGLIIAHFVGPDSADMKQELRKNLTKDLNETRRRESVLSYYSDLRSTAFIQLLEKP